MGWAAQESYPAGETADLAQLLWETGLLAQVNAAVLHPQGLALGVDVDKDGQTVHRGWAVTYEEALRHYTVRKRMAGGWDVLFDGKDWLHAGSENLPLGSDCSAFTRRGAVRIARRLARHKAESAALPATEGPAAKVPTIDLRATQ